eukprot:1936104-Amphidinium_carterae.2
MGECSPFPVELIQHFRTKTAQWLGISNHAAEDKPDGQPFHLNLLYALASRAQDADAAFALELCDPMPLGVEEALRPTPGIFRNKTATERSLLPHSELQSALNYPSALEHERALVANFDKEVKEGLVAGPFESTAAVASFIGCQESELIVGALTARPESGKTRTIYDASVTQVNDRIRAHIPQVTEAPGVADLRHALALEHSQGRHLTATKMDISAAHRRVRIQKKDWKYMVAKCGSAYYVNKVGTFGVASAQYHWGRLAALLNRLCYHLTEGSYNLVYVDDFLFLHEQTNADRDRLSVLILMLILGVPLSWKKLQFGQLLEWIGIEVNLMAWTLRPSPERLPSIISFLDLIAQGSSIHLKPLRRVMGVLAWFTGIIPHLKVFLGPLYAWLHALQGSGRPSKQLRAIARAFMTALHMPVEKPCDFYRQSHGEGATDAGASNTSAAIGGWWSPSPGTPKCKVSWFAEPITSQRHPWAW